MNFLSRRRIAGMLGGMLKLLRNGYVRWGLCASALIGLGVGIYQVQAPEPMCTIENGGIPLCFAGGRMVTVISDSPRVRRQGPILAADASHDPVRIWDVKDGRLLQTFRHNDKLDNKAIDELLAQLGVAKEEIQKRNETGVHLGGLVVSAQNRHVAYELATGVVVIVNILDGTTREIPVPGAHFGSLRFTPNGDYLVRISSNGVAKSLRTFEAATGKLTASRATLGLVTGDAITDDAVIHFVSFGEQQQVEVMDPRDGKVKAVVHDIHNAGRGGKYLLGDRRDGSKNRWYIEVWSVETGKAVTTFEPENSLFPVSQMFSTDGRWLAVTTVGRDGDTQTELRDFPECIQHRKPVARQAIAFSRDQRFLATVSSVNLLINDMSSLQVNDTSSMNELWNAKHVRSIDSVFSNDSRTAFVLVDNPPALRCLDAATGQLRREFPLHTQNSTTEAEMTPDQRFVMVRRGHGKRNWPDWFTHLPWLPGYLEQGRNDIVHVVDTESCKPRLTVLGWDAWASWLSDDGRTLVTAHRESETRQVLRCWAVDGWKRLRWAVGVPASLALLGVLLAWWRSRRSKRKEAPCPG
jgi:WD40 repeat protein